TYGLDQRQLALENTTIIDPPGEYFSYNKYHPQLLGMILERATGMSVTEYTQTRLWDRVGMEFDGAWALDSETSRFEKMEAGLNARAIDYAKLGRLFLTGGVWNGEQVVSDDWIGESTSLDPSTHHPDYYPDHWGQIVYADGGGYYKYMWYGALRDSGEYDFYAVGDHGQYLYVSPSAQMVIVRNGTEFGMPSEDWTDAFYEFAGG
ncbi:MAG: serine hydrolase, partial [Acidimicrobiia bacterium]|nr:serine hydrolase [Acidimicrobiia bacterium]